MTSKQILTKKENEVYLHPTGDKHTVLDHKVIPVGESVLYEDFINEAGNRIQKITTNDNYSARIVTIAHNPNHQDFGGQWVMLSDLP